MMENHRTIEVETREFSNEVRFSALCRLLATTNDADTRFPTSMMIVIISHDESIGPKFETRISIDNKQENYYHDYYRVRKEQNNEDVAVHLVYVWRDICGDEAYIPVDEYRIDSSEIERFKAFING